MKNVISTDKAPAAIGPYSQAIEVNGTVYTSGIIPVVPATGEIPEGSVAQAQQAFENLSNLLEATCGTFPNACNNVNCFSFSEINVNSFLLNSKSHHFFC